MGRIYDEIDERLAAFIEGQPVFFVATAPSSDDGHVNLSPKGLETFAVLGPRRVAYLDLTGSGVETIAHLRENGRICLLFCAFTGAPKLLRLHGHAHAVLRDDDRFDELAARFPPFEAARAVIDVEVSRIADSCGYGVPLMSYEGPRPTLLAWADRKGPDGIEAYQRERNAESIDGLPGLAPPVAR